MIKASEAKAVAQNIGNSKEVTTCISEISSVVNHQCKLGKYRATITSYMVSLRSSEQREAVCKILRDHGYEVKETTGPYDPRDQRTYDEWTISWS